MTAPTLTGFSFSVTFAEDLVNFGPQLMDTSVVFTDAEGDFNGGILTLSGLLAEDSISIRNQGTGAGQIGLSGTNVTFGGVTIGTLTGGDGETLNITFNASATTAGIDALIQNLTYANASNSPDPGRTLVLNITDAADNRLNAAPAIFTTLTGAANPLDGFQFDTHSRPSFVDLDGDGDLDMVVGDYTGRLQSFANNGSGGFIQLSGAANPFLGLDVGRYSAPGFGDLDGDGDMDLVIGSRYATLQTFTNNGANVFTEQTGAANPFDGLSFTNDASPSFVDLNNDGDMDAVVGASNGMLRSFANDGAGGFTELTGAANPFDGVDVGDVSTPSFVDLDGDGDMDAVVGTFYGTLLSFANDGAGGFTELTGAANPFNGVDLGRYTSIGFVDLNGDRIPDAVVGEEGGGLIVFANTQAVSISINVTPDSNVPKLTGLSASVTFAENTVNVTPQRLDTAVVFTDDDGDFKGGRVTLSGLVAEDRVSVFNQGTGAGQIGLSGATVTFGGVTIGTLAGGVGTTLAITLNASATTAAVDALVQNLTYANVSNVPTASRTLALDVTDAVGAHLNETTPTFAPLSFGANPFNGLDFGQYSTPSFVDLDGDGDMDAVVGGVNDTVRSFTNDGAGGFSELAGAANPLAGVNGDLFSAPGFGDVDGDGDMDAVVGGIFGELKTYSNDGTGVFTELSEIDNPFAAVDVSRDSTPSFVDIDGDGDIDAVVGGRYGTLQIFANNGAGVFTERTGAANPFNGFTFGDDVTPSFVDLDNDGDMDAVIGQENGTLRYFANNGAGRFFERTGAANPFASVGADADSAPGFVDLDGDGDLDLVLGDNAGRLLSFENTSPAHSGPLVSIRVNVTSQLDTFTGGTGNDNLVGTVQADVMRGLDGNDTLNGAGGLDTLIGGTGNDSYITNGGDKITEASGAGTDTVKSSVTFTLGANLEHLTLTGAAAINGTGNSGANRITGNTAANVLNGGGGLDTLIGGSGNDTYITDGGDRITEGSGAGIDTVWSSVTLTLGANLEKLVLTGSSAINGSGNTLANTLTGNGEENVLTGGGGTDTLIGGAQSDILFGGDGSDSLNGGLGSDSLTGGQGSDSFIFDAAPGQKNADRIADYNVTADTIRLEGGIFTGIGNGAVSGNEFHASLSGNAADASDRILYETDSGKVFYDSDGAGGAARLLFAIIDPGLALTGADFLIF